MFKCQVSYPVQSFHIVTIFNSFLFSVYNHPISFSILYR
jgi:hypothetical protein